MRSRALRRHHLSSLKKRVQAYQCKLADKFADEHDRARIIGRLARTRKGCSCWMCGNPRRFGEQTVAERRADSAWRHDSAR
ncbi:MAG: hypothetical protein AB1451_16295 [Nitrospirota bacterium]